MIKGNRIKSYITIALCMCFTSTYIHAAVISIDWQSANDNLITRDTNSGLDWLDLTVTRNASYNDVISLLGTGGTLNGWRYATSSEVLNLWAGFGVDLTDAYKIQSSGEDPGVMQASQYLGSTMCAYDCTKFPYGTYGISEDTDQNPNNFIGAHYYPPSDVTAYSPFFSLGNHPPSLRIEYVGSYLVQTSTVPLPPSILLFIFGALGLVGFSQFKNRNKKTT